MHDLWEFLRGHGRPIAAMLVGIGSAAYGIVSAGHEITTWLLPAWGWQLVGLLVFVAAILTILFHWDRYLTGKHQTASNSAPLPRIVPDLGADVESADARVVELVTNALVRAGTGGNVVSHNLAPHERERMSKMACELYDIIRQDMSPLPVLAQKLIFECQERRIAPDLAVLDALSERIYHARDKVKALISGSFDESTFGFLNDGTVIDCKLKEAVDLYSNAMRAFQEGYSLELLTGYNFSLRHAAEAYDDWTQKALSRLKLIAPV